MFPVMKDAARHGKDWAIYQAIVSNLAPVERIAEVYNKTPEGRRIRRNIRLLHFQDK